MGKKNKGKGKGLLAEFKAFISRGNVLDMAVGVIIGGAFSAIVTAVVNILLSLCAAALPGGLSGLITPLYTQTALSTLATVQSTMPEAEMVLTADSFLALCNQYGAETVKSIYVQYGGKYVFSACPVLNWGALINAVISFLIIALVLFIVLKIVNYVKTKNALLKAKQLEAYYEKHPEERPVPPEPGKPAPTTNELLEQIRDLLAGKKDVAE